MNTHVAFKRWVKKSRHPVARLIRIMHGKVRGFETPMIAPIHNSLYALHQGGVDILGWVARVFYWTPLFKSRLAGRAPGLYLYGGMPLMTGPLQVRFGRACRVSGQTTFSGRWTGNTSPEFTVGDNVDVGWQTTIAVGTKVVLGDNVRIAGRAFLAGYPGHPLNARDRAAGLPDTEDQIGDIILEDDVWLCTGVTVTAGVRIGRGTVVAAGSVVTRDLPAGVLAGGVPARVIRELSSECLKLAV